MKRTIAVVLAIAVVIATASCSAQSKSDQQIADLKQQLDSLKAQASAASSPSATAVITSSSTPTASPTVTAAPTVVASQSQVAVPAAAAPVVPPAPTAPTVGQQQAAIIAVGRTVLEPYNLPHVWDLCVKYAVSGVAYDSCIRTVDPAWAAGSGPVVLGMTPEAARAHFLSSYHCYDSVVVGNPLPTCWPR